MKNIDPAAFWYALAVLILLAAGTVTVAPFLLRQP